MGEPAGKREPIGPKYRKSDGKVIFAKTFLLLGKVTFNELINRMTECSLFPKLKRS